MSAVISVLPSGASHGIASGVSVSRKNGNSGLGRPRHRVGEQAPAPEAQVREHHRPVAEREEAIERVGAVDEAGEHVDRRRTDHGRRRDLAPGDAHADRAAFAHGDAARPGCGAGSSRRPRSRAAGRRWRCRARGRRARRWRSAGPPRSTRPRPARCVSRAASSSPTVWAMLLGILSATGGRELGGRCPRPRLDERQGDLVRERAAVVPAELLVRGARWLGVALRALGQRGPDEAGDAQQAGRVVVAATAEPDRLPVPLDVAALAEHVGRGREPVGDEVRAGVEREALGVDVAVGHAADLVAGFVEDDVEPVAQQLARRREPRDATADDDDGRGGDLGPDRGHAGSGSR